MQNFVKVKVIRGSSMTLTLNRISTCIFITPHVDFIKHSLDCRHYTELEPNSQVFNTNTLDSLFNVFGKFYLKAPNEKLFGQLV